MPTWLDHYPTLQPFLQRPDDVLLGVSLEPFEAVWGESPTLEALRRLQHLTDAALARLAATQEDR